MDDLFWFLLCLIPLLPLFIFGLHYIIIGNKLNNRELTGKTNGYLDSYEYKQNVYDKGGRRIRPYSTSFRYAYTVDGRKYKLGFHVYAKPKASMKRTIKVVYLKSAPKFAYCNATYRNYTALGWILLILGLIWCCAILLLAFIG